MKIGTDKFCPHCTGEKGSLAAKYDALITEITEDKWKLKVLKEADFDSAVFN